MGCFGIGITRLMGVVVVKALSDEKGIVWPESVAPFRFHLVNLAVDDEEVTQVAEEMYQSLKASGYEVLYDERIGISAGEKFNDSDLIGIPTRIVVSKKTMKEFSDTGVLRFETKDRRSGEVKSSNEKRRTSQNLDIVIDVSTCNVTKVNLLGFFDLRGVFA